LTIERTFESLCILASQEKWCWRMPCTTCGNVDFRFALRELTEGRLSEEWWSLATHRTRLHQRLKALEPLRRWPIAVQHALVAKIANTDIAAIARRSRFPDWRGLGLALLLTENAESRDRLLTPSWSRQLLQLLPARVRERSGLSSTLVDMKTILTWRHLEGVEHAILGISEAQEH
jgi:hypothetical protein